MAWQFSSACLTVRLYRKRRDAVFKAITEYLPDVSVILPQGGLFIWLILPEGLSASALLVTAAQQGMTFAPGGWFYAEPAEGERYLRLNFASVPEEKIEEGIRRLGRATN